MDLFYADGTRVRMFASGAEELNRLVRQVMFDLLPPSDQADLVYCMALTEDAQPAVLDKAVQLWGSGVAPRIGVCRGTTKHGYCGFAFCVAGLIARGVERNDIIPVDLLPEDGENLNTFTEANVLRSVAVKNGWRRVIVSSAFFHQLRASSTIVSMLDAHDPEVWIYNRPADAPSWYRPILHSQGVLSGTPLELLIEEIWRLFRYYSEGYLRSCREILDYYERRDMNS